MGTGTLAPKYPVQPFAKDGENSAQKEGNVRNVVVEDMSTMVPVEHVSQEEYMKSEPKPTFSNGAINSAEISANYMSNVSSMPENENEINPRYVDDDDLVEALFLCEQSAHFRDKITSQPKGNITDVKSSTNNRLLTVEDDTESDKYSNLPYYLKVVTEKAQAKAVIEQCLPYKGNSIGSMKDYSSENPYGKNAKVQLIKLCKKKRKVIKRLRNNKLISQRFNNLQRKCFPNFPKDQHSPSLYIKFKKDLQIMQLSARTKRMLSTNSQDMSPLKKRKRVSMLYSKAFVTRNGYSMRRLPRVKNWQRHSYFLIIQSRKRGYCAQTKNPKYKRSNGKSSGGQEVHSNNCTIEKSEALKEK